MFLISFPTLRFCCSSHGSRISDLREFCGSSKPLCVDVPHVALLESSGVGSLEGKVKDAPEFPFVLLVGFSANEWRWVAAAAAAGYALFRGDAAAGALHYIFTLEERHSVPVDLKHVIGNLMGEVWAQHRQQPDRGYRGSGVRTGGRQWPVFSQPAAALHERLGHSG